jgi:hypothetical protein
MITELLRFTTDSSIYFTNTNNMNIAYVYNGNSVAYCEIPEQINSDLVVTDASKHTTFKQCLEIGTVIPNETPFVFDFTTESPEKEISPNTFKKLFSLFTKFYNVEDYRTELSGIHVRDGMMFASDATIMRLKKTEIFGSDTNMIIDIIPFLEFISTDNKKIKSTGKSLFSSKKTDNIVFSIIQKNGEVALKIRYQNLNFIIVSIGESKVPFKYIDIIKPTNTIKIHKQVLIDNLTELLNENVEYDNDYIKNYIRFNLKQKLEISNYVFYKDGHKILPIKYEQTLSKSNLPFFVLDGMKLLVILKSIDSDIVYINYDTDGLITTVTYEGNENSDTLLIAQTIYK